MRLSLNWLKDYVDIEMSHGDLGELLTMSGLEVETVEPIGQSLQEIIATRVLSVKRHPDADRLFICHVDTGKERLPVVCSAPNLEKNAMVPLALPGTKLHGQITVREGLIRGERSVGMLLAEDEMGLTDDHSGIMILPNDLEPGTSVSSSMALEDWAFDISITPNRPDCASVTGVAREIAALTGQKLKGPKIEITECGTLIEDLAGVTIVDSEGCPRYAAGMIEEVDLHKSPFWLRYRLYVSGIRSINNVVDVTNYVLLELGQPLHAFDYDRLRENRIVVRRAEDGETFTTLDGTTHTLNRENLMICDGERPVALAGIMGGLNSEIFAGSKNVLVESAFFDPITIRRGSKRLGLSTEASYRFERGIDIEGVTTALQRAMMLISQMAGGKIIKGLIDIYPRPYRPRKIDLRVDATNRFLGTSLSKDQMAGYLKALEMEVQERDDNLIRVKPPALRVDIEREVDLMEEVARLEGYDRIPVTYPAIRPSDEPEIPELALRDSAREIMVGLGFTEIITYSFISPDSADLLGAEEKSSIRSFVKLLNSLTIDQSVMRTSLVPGLLATMSTNITNGEKDLKLFEWGKIFIHDDTRELPGEELYLTAMMTGLIEPKEWHSEERFIDFYDLKGVVESLLEALGLKAIQFQKGDTPPWYDPEISSGISVLGSKIGTLGQLSRDVLMRSDMKTESAYLFELDIKQLFEKIPGRKSFQPLARFPAVLRDISLIVSREMESGRIMEVIRREGGDLLESITLYDLYEGEKVASSEKAMNFRICYRSKEGTLDGKEINQLHETVINKIIKETGGRLREGLGKHEDT